MDYARHSSAPLTTPQVGGILGQAKRTVINGGQFTSVISTTTAQVDGFILLQKHVATSAFHNSCKRADPPRCHENTRQAILKEIFDWLTLPDAVRTTWIAWLNGAAGAGKTAICQSVAEMCIAEGILVASFFFFRTDPTRNTITPLVATLAYQCVQLVPQIKDIIVNTIQSNPLIFEQSFETQLSDLIIKPLRWLQFLGIKINLRLIIDGVDECHGQENQLIIIHTVAKFLAIQDSPIIVLFGSRTERQIQSAFRSPHICRVLYQLPLDDHYMPSHDIDNFIRGKFSQIKNTHPFSRLIPDSWPPAGLIQEIVYKSSGQFIYASVVMKFISDPRSLPTRQSDIIRGLRSSGSSTPFSQLDTVYRQIFSQARDILLIKSLLSYVILGDSTNLTDIARFFGISEADIHIGLTDLSSVISCEGGQIHFLHASLPDFLMEARRSGVYHIDSVHWSTQLLIMWLQNSASGRFDDRNYMAVLNLLNHAEGSPELRAHILTFNPYQHSQSFVRFFTDYLSAIRHLDFGDGGEVYHHQLNAITRCARKLRLQIELPLLQRSHDVSEILAEIEREDAEDRQAMLSLQSKTSQITDASESPKRSSRRSKILSWVVKGL